MHRTHTATLAPERVFRALLAIIAVITVCHLGALVALYGYDHDTLLGFVPLFYLDGEANVGSWFSTVLLAACAGVLVVIAATARRAADPQAGRWRMLAGVFALLSLDEAAVIHERIGAALERGIDASGLLTQVWVAPALVFVAAVGLWMLPLLTALPRPVMWRFLVAGAVYVGSAAGLEMLEGLRIEHAGRDLGYALLVTVEEPGEMLGAALFLWALLDHLAAWCPAPLRLAESNAVPLEAVAPMPAES